MDSGFGHTLAMKESRAFSAFLFIVAVVVMVPAFCFGVCAGRAKCYIEMREQAIENGAARWVIDQKTGERSFEWVPCSERDAGK